MGFWVGRGGDPLRDRRGRIPENRLDLRIRRRPARPARPVAPRERASEREDREGLRVRARIRVAPAETVEPGGEIPFRRLACPFREPVLPKSRFDQGKCTTKGLGRARRARRSDSLLFQNRAHFRSLLPGECRVWSGEFDDITPLRAGSQGGSVCGGSRSRRGRTVPGVRPSSARPERAKRPFRVICPAVDDLAATRAKPSPERSCRIGAPQTRHRLIRTAALRRCPSRRRGARGARRRRESRARRRRRSRRGRCPERGTG